MKKNCQSDTKVLVDRDAAAGIGDRVVNSALRKTFWSSLLATPKRIVLMQFAAGLILSGVLGLFTGCLNWALSVGWGAFCVVLPSFLLAHGAFRKGINGQVAILRFYFWEAAKLILTAAMLVLAPKVVANLNWWFLLLGFVVVMKVYGLAAWLHVIRVRY